MTCPKCSAPLIEGVAFCESCGAVVRIKPIQDPLLGRTLLQQYVIKKKLGEGGFGAVYLAEQPSMGRQVAIKTLHQRTNSSPDITARFMREGIVACRLEHPNAIKMFNLGETEDGHLWIAMEFLEGKTLAEHLKESGPLSPTTLIEVMGPVCEVLSEAHEKGIIHRDLKPENIMLVAQKGKLLPKVLDFGIAGILDDSSGPTTTGTITGTPPYMPPEQWSGLKHTDARSDIYALGVIIYQCLSGKLPFDAETTPAWVLQHVNVAPKPLSAVLTKGDLPPRLEEVVMKALAKSPAERHQTVRAFYDALRDTLMYPNATLPDASLRTIEQPPSARPLAAQWLVLGLSASMLLLSVIFWWTSPKPATLKAPAIEPKSAPITMAPSALEPVQPKEPTPKTPGELTREERAIKSVQLYEEAVQMYASKNYLEAQRLIEKANAFDPNFPELTRMQGLLYLASSQAEKACVYFHRYLKLVPGSIYERDIVLTMQMQNPNIAPSCTRLNDAP